MASERPQSGKKNKKEMAVDVSANSTTQLFIALSGNVFFDPNADETIYENNDREPAFLQNGEKSLKTHEWETGDLFAFLLLRQLSEKQNLKPEEFCPRRRGVGGSPGD